MVKARKQKQSDQGGWWQIFAQHVLSGLNFTEAYQLARPQIVGRWDITTIRTKASQLGNSDRVQSYIAAETAKIAAARRKREAKLMTMLDRREICREVATAEESNGLTKLAAVKTDAQLAGEWLERQEVSQTVNLQALLAELPQSGLPVAREVAPALPVARPDAPPEPNAVQSLPRSSACDWELLDE